MTAVPARPARTAEPGLRERIELAPYPRCRDGPKMSPYEMPQGKEEIQPPGGPWQQSRLQDGLRV